VPKEQFLSELRTALDILTQEKNLFNEVKSTEKINNLFGRFEIIIFQDNH
jgi:hypothetical protein